MSSRFLILTSGIVHNQIKKLCIDNFVSVFVLGISDKRQVFLENSFLYKLCKIKIKKIVVCFLKNRRSDCIWVCSVYTRKVLAKHCFKYRKLSCVHIAASACAVNIFCAADEIKYLFDSLPFFCRIV